MKVVPRVRGPPALCAGGWWGKPQPALGLAFLQVRFLDAGEFCGVAGWRAVIQDGG